MKNDYMIVEELVSLQNVRVEAGSLVEKMAVALYEEFRRNKPGSKTWDSLEREDRCAWVASARLAYRWRSGSKELPR